MDRLVIFKCIKDRKELTGDLQLYFLLIECRQNSLPISLMAFNTDTENSKPILLKDLLRNKRNSF